MVWYGKYSTTRRTGAMRHGLITHGNDGMLKQSASWDGHIVAEAWNGEESKIE